MKTFLKIVGVLFGLIILLIYSILLAATPALISASLLITNRENPKKWITQSDLYTSVSSTMQKTISKELSKEGVNTKQLKSMNSLLEKIITPQYLEKNTTAFIDSVYDWAQGKSDNINIDSEELNLKEILRESVPKEDLEAVKLLENLKPCTEQQALQYEKTGGFDSIEEMCLPPQIDLIEIVDDNYDQEVIQSPTDSIGKLIDTTKIDEKTLSNIRLGFWAASNLHYILPGVLLLLLTIFLLILPSGSFKYYFVAIITVLLGTTNFVISQLSGFVQVYASTYVQQIPFGSIPISISSVQTLVKTITDDIFNMYSTVSIIIMVTGSVMFIGAIIYSIAKNHIEKKKAQESSE